MSGRRAPIIRAKKLIRIFKKLGFIPVRQKGGHIFFKNADGRQTVIPRHDDQYIDRSLLIGILKEAEVSKDEFFKHL